ncbi:MAG: aminopeptidase N [Burkholderiales bacterium]|nr:aminopeptidase N [Burkholderiales bacterium]
MKATLVMQNQPEIKYLKDYQQPNYFSQNIRLCFEILSQQVIVKSDTDYQQNTSQSSGTLKLSGSAKLLELKVNNTIHSDYTLANDELTINNLPKEFTLSITTEVDAFNNKSCMGLYASQGNLFTQCEPEGFRKITYYLDRPDVMALFTTTIIAKTQDYPILLSNGNKISEEQLPDGRTKVVWQDPFKKPSYLFALVAGKFSKIDTVYTTQSGRKVLLEVYSEPESINQCQHCLDSLVRSMRWDEQRFNLEYDLERYMIVASGDFNMGAMENKGLNIFNTKYVLAETKTATDSDFINVEAVVGHEYFHNWTGNRVTCRDWFQLSLKEGLTVFRDQEFTADLHARDVKRIQTVKTLRQNQFPEDASPLAHPVRPASYLEINNFYTMTVYEKGAEVVRMYQTLLGRAGFERGMRLYFERHDGSAVTCDDFCQAMADANNFDLSQFMLWYSQAGTPTLKISDSYDPVSQIYTLNIEQQIPDTTDMHNKQAMLIPLELGLISAAGQALEFSITDGEIIYPEEKAILLIAKQHNEFKIKVTQQPTPSLLRGFSAPVVLDYAYTPAQLLNLAAHDSDSFNRWEAMQKLYQHAVIALYQNPQNTSAEIFTQLSDALAKTLQDKQLNPSIQNLISGLPSFAELCTQLKSVDVAKLNQAIVVLKSYLADSLEALWLATYQQNQCSSYDFNDAGKRALKNTALAYLLSSKNAAKYLNLVQKQYLAANNMTDKLAALIAINDSDDNLRAELLIQFNHEYQNYPLVMDKWFTLQSQSSRADTLEQVKKLTTHPQYDNANPNKLYSLIRAFTANSSHFNSAEGYKFIAAEILRVDKFNSGVSARIAHGFSILTSLAPEYQQLAKPVLGEILATEKLSNDVYELISKTILKLI